MDAFELFKIDISKFSYLEFADWIISCRQEVPTPDGKHSEEYLNKVSLFCEKWEEHFAQNEDVYASEEYKKALLHIGHRGKFKFVVDFGEGKEDITQQIMANTQVRFIEKEKIPKKTFDEENRNADIDIINLFKTPKDFKVNFRKIIRDTLGSNSITKIRIFKDGKLLTTSSYEELVKLCEEFDNYIIVPENRIASTSFLPVLEKYGVPKTIYSDYMNKHNSEKLFDKKFFINLALALSLPCEYAEKLLLYNGYSIKDSIREFDVICEKGLRIGFGRDYIIALIEKYNADMKKENPDYTELQNITVQKRQRASAK